MMIIRISINGDNNYYGNDDGNNDYEYYDNKKLYNKQHTNLCTSNDSDTRLNIYRSSKTNFALCAKKVSKSTSHGFHSER